MYMYVYVCICMYMYVYVCMCMYVYVYVCICMFIYIYMGPLSIQDTHFDPVGWYSSVA